jgi:hypothetical protein
VGPRPILVTVHVHEVRSTPPFDMTAFAEHDAKVIESLVNTLVLSKNHSNSLDRYTVLTNFPLGFPAATV